MTLKRVVSGTLHGLRTGITCLAMAQLAIGLPAAQAQEGTSNDSKTTTPIKHVIVIIGENRSFDHVFATYVPKDGQKVWNLLSEGIINANGTPGPNFSKFQQSAAVDQAPDAFLLSPDKVPFQKGVLPAPLVGGPSIDGVPTVSYIPSTVPLSNPPVSYTPQQLQTLAIETENGLPLSYSPSILTGGTLLAHETPDDRIANVTSLPPGPFQLTGSTFSYDDYAASPVHRFYQMWQQLDCSVQHATIFNP